jgi:hypothetical protein
VGAMRRNVDNAKKLIQSLQQRTEKLLAEPTKYDPVYKVVQRLFKNDNPFNLTRENQDRHRIRRLARHRFVLGYPPRKESDNSVGDAVDWEWLVDCASRERKSVIVASRDSDYGATIDGKRSYINDWLLQEFRARVSKRANVLLTPKFTEAFQLMQIKVSAKDVEEEEEIILQLRTKQRWPHPYRTTRSFFPARVSGRTLLS